MKDIEATGFFLQGAETLLDGATNLAETLDSLNDKPITPFLTELDPVFSEDSVLFRQLIQEQQ